jgi:hypothetical protein
MGVSVSAQAGPSAQQTPEAQALAALRAAEAGVTAHTAAEYGLALDGSHGSPGLLEGQWAQARRWTSAWLETHPNADLAQLSTDAKRDAALEISTIRLDADSLLVSVTVDALGTVFILRRNANRRYVTVITLDEPQTWGGDGPRELAAWRDDRATANCREHRSQAEWLMCGPLAPELALLPNETDGSRRFVLVGRYVKGAGATDAYQVSIWRWTGRKAEPLLAYTLDQMADEPVIIKTGPGKLVLHAKSEFKRMFACGGCSGRQVEVDFDLPAHGAKFAGTRSLVPELDLVDDLYDRLFRSESPNRLATPSVVTALARTVRSTRQDARKLKLTPSLGMLMSWKSGERDGASTLCLSTDRLNAPQLFTLDRMGGQPHVRAVRDVPDRTCDGPDSHS